MNVRSSAFDLFDNLAPLSSKKCEREKAWVDIPIWGVIMKNKKEADQRCFMYKWAVLYISWFLLFGRKCIRVVVIAIYVMVMISYLLWLLGRHRGLSGVLHRCHPNREECRSRGLIRGCSWVGRKRPRLWICWPELRSGPRSCWTSSGRSLWQDWRRPDSAKSRSLASTRHITLPGPVCTRGRLEIDKNLKWWH